MPLRMDIRHGHERQVVAVPVPVQTERLPQPIQSAEDTSSGGRSNNVSGSLLAHFLRAKPPVFISSVNLWTRCRASSTSSQLVARSSTYISDNTLSVSASMFPRALRMGGLPTCMGQEMGKH
ncbi:putative supporter of activation of yellow protein, partial [Trichinella spiralis]|uniref:putative supporter of activation of yellow protein n=1 Tax=Trichinella spiralis TaxID=6334 RepID=UPI0001EFD8D3